MSVFAWISYGLGGQVLDPAGGEVLLTQKIKALGVNVGSSPYLYSDVQTICDEILTTPEGSVIIVGGDSLGANNAPYIATAIRAQRGVDYLFGFQPSVWGYHSEIPPSVVTALCIYNPNWVETFGLGDYPWPLMAGNTRTKGARGRPDIYMTNSDPHPGDNDPIMHDVIISDIKVLL